MATKYGQIKLRLPKGFPGLLEGFAREVLREQPTDISKFGAEYFRDLLDHRSATGEDPLKKYAELEDRHRKDKHFGTESGDVLRPVDSTVREKEIREENAATKIQASYKGHVARQRRHKQEVAATKIQAGYRGYTTRKRLQEEPQPKKGYAEEKTEEITLEYDDDQKAAAVRIQASFRGHKARQELAGAKEKEEPVDEEQQAAAIRIQANYRGYKTRREIKGSKDKNVEFEEEMDEIKKQDEKETVDDAEDVTKQDEHETVDDSEDVTKQDEHETVYDAEDITKAPQADAEREEAGEVQEEEEKDEEDADAQEDEQEEPSPAEGQVGEDAEELGTAEPEVEAEERVMEGEEDKAEDEKDLEQAALKIQAQFRGYQTRKVMKQGEPHKASETEEALEVEISPTVEDACEQPTEVRDEEADEAKVISQEVTEDDPKQVLAATKIQAQYRGYKARKGLKESKEEIDRDDDAAEQVADGQPETTE